MLPAKGGSNETGNKCGSRYRSRAKAVKSETPVSSLAKMTVEICGPDRPPAKAIYAQGLSGL